MQGYVGLAKHLICCSCLKPFFVGSSGLWGQRLILPKIAPPGAFKDDLGHAVTFQCYYCVGKDPVMLPVIHPNGQSIDNIQISILEDAQDLTSIIREEGDYDARQEIADIHKQAQK